MIKFENTEVFNWEGAIRGMRNPLNSWAKSDSSFYDPFTGRGYCQNGVMIGENDLKLMKNLIKAGSDHRKFMRQILVSVDITSWATWWAEFDTYKVGTVRNSCSKMHKIHVKEFTKDDFSTEGIDSLNDEGVEMGFYATLGTLNYLRKSFNDLGDKRYWRALLEILPHGYNMKATVTLNYEVLRNMYHARKNHKLDEWSIGFTEWVKTLPYAEDLIIN